eukprot:s7754_g4.t1
MHPPPAPDSTVIPLQHCDSAWKFALDHPDVVDELLAGEVAEDWIKLVSGGDAELRRLYPVTAVGKLGLVLAEGRPPCLVVDISVSGITSNTALPNRSSNPTLADVFNSMPLSDSAERLVALVLDDLDVATAHRRILIRSSDRGLLCFRHRQKLYQCLTLNFGARVSSFYWARAAGLLVRLIHRLIRVRHSAQIYVDDLSAILESVSAPLWKGIHGGCCAADPVCPHLAQGCPLRQSRLDRMGAKSLSLLCPSGPCEILSSLRLTPSSIILQALLYPSAGAYHWKAPLVLVSVSDFPSLSCSTLCGPARFPPHDDCPAA